MSLIIGINLSDRVYLSADTRLTFDVGGSQKYLDNFLKIKPLSQKIAVAVAGDIQIASFIVRRIIKSNINKDNIREFRKDVPILIKSLADEYLRQYKELKAVCFIFAGINRGKEKMIEMRKYQKITKEFQKETGSSMSMKDIIFQGLSRLGKGKVKVPKFLKIPTVDSHVFCVKLLPQEFLVEDISWGDFVAYGGGLTKNNLPPRFFGQFEVAGTAGIPKDDKAWLDIFLKTVAEENNIKTIGGCVTSLIISQKNSGMLLGGTKKINFLGITEVVSEINIINKKLHGFINGSSQRLIPFTLYEDMLLRQYPKAENLSL